MDNLYRKVTEREIYEERYGRLHEMCMRMVIEKAKHLSKEYDIPIECFDISALTFQHWQRWLTNRQFIINEKSKRQQELNERK